MAAKLVAEEGNLKGLVLSLEEGDTWVIGRDPESCQLVIEDPLTSRKHLIARRTTEGILVENLSTTNPIQINEEGIGSQSRLLQQGDTIKIGSEIFRFYADSSIHVMEAELNTSADNSFPTTDPAASRLPVPEAPLPEEEEEENPRLGDTILDDNDTAFDALAEINFGISDTGRWLLKVVGGPNNGAEFYMRAGQSYILGTDPHTCDVVFHDTSVSRQHAKITVTPEDTLLIEDLKSRNGVLISGNTLEGKQTLSPSMIVNIGTTSFVVYDREGEMQTIISPLLPSIVKVLQQEEEKANSGLSLDPLVKIPSDVASIQPLPTLKPARHLGPLILLAIIIGLFTIAGLGTASLFRSEPVVVQSQENATELVQQALAPFPAVRFSFNKSTGGLLLLGHVATASDKNQLLYNLQGLKTFVKYTDDTGIIIDEFVWQEINSVLSKNPAWRGITIHSPAAGQFILSGYLQTRKQAEQLSDYISINFPYLDLLKKQIVVEEDVVNQINAWLQDGGLKAVTAKMTNDGEVTLAGAVATDKLKEVNQVITKVKEISGVRVVNNLVQTQTQESGLINITNRYDITGHSKSNNKFTVVINGRILSEGDALDGMTITSIKPNAVMLEKEGTKYQIDYNR